VQIVPSFSDILPQLHVNLLIFLLYSKFAESEIGRDARRDEHIVDGCMGRLSDSTVMFD